MFGLRSLAGLAQSSTAFIRPVRQLSTSAVLETKLKTHKGTAKRWKAIANGGFKRAQAGKQHLNSSFAPSRINGLSRTVYASTTQKKILKQLLPYA